MGVPCRKDDCNRSFDSERGMKLHHCQIHGEKIGKQEVNCHWCGDTFLEWESELNRNEKTFCNNECFGEWQSNKQTKENNPNWQGGRLKSHTCIICGDNYKNYKDSSDTSYCSKSCIAEDLKDRVGEDCPSWKGGAKTYYGHLWNDRREEAIKQAGNKCERCGISREEHKFNHGIDLHVHHIKPYRLFEDDEEAHKLDNLIAACKYCHQELEKESTKIFNTDTDQ